MGGVDRMDQNVELYRTGVRSKKWWWPLFSWVLKSTIVNSYVYMNSSGKKNGSFLDHTRSISRYLITSFGRTAISRAPCLIHDSLRYDRKDHWPIKGASKYMRCRLCSRRTTYICQKCNAPLNIECFMLYHSQ